jgi:hypothetical protein
MPMPSINEKLARLNMRVLQTADDDTLTATQRAELAQHHTAPKVPTSPRSPALSGTMRRKAKSKYDVAVDGGEQHAGGEASSAPARRPTLEKRGSAALIPHQLPLAALCDGAVNVEAALEAAGYGPLHRRLALAVLLSQLTGFGEPVLAASLLSPAAWCGMPWSGEAFELGGRSAAVGAAAAG